MKSFNKVLVLILAAVMAFSIFSCVAFAEKDEQPAVTQATDTVENKQEEDDTTSQEDVKQSNAQAFNGKVASADNYDAYQSRYAQTSAPKDVIRLTADQAVEFDAETGEAIGNLPLVKAAAKNKPQDEREGAVFYDEGICGWVFNVPADGMYSIRLSYFAYDTVTYQKDGEQVTDTSKSASIQRKLFIDYQVPFYEARQVNFERVWKDSSLLTIDTQTQNEKRPYQEETGQWQLLAVRDYMGYEEEPYRFYFSAGEHTLAFEAIKEGMIVEYAELCQLDKAPSYQAYASSVSKYNKVSGEPIIIQAEGLHDPDVYIKKQASVFLSNSMYDAYKSYSFVEDNDPTKDVTYNILKSAPTLYAITDRSSPATVPYHHSKIRYNTIGADKWQSPNEWIEWNITVPEDGLYALTFKARQNTLSGMYTTRKLTINGVQPCEEVGAIRFEYSNSFANYTLGDETNGTYYFHLNQGSNAIRLETCLGKLGPLLDQAEESLTQLNAAYRQILMITGSTPDANNDYQLGVFVPEALETIRVQYETLLKLEEDFTKEFGKSASAQLSSVKNMELILKEIVHDETTVASLFANYKDAIASMGTWINDMSQTPLELDYIVVSPAANADKGALPKASSGFFANLLHELRSFIASFTEDYDNIGGTVSEDGQDPVVVWIETGTGLTGSRDNATILKQLIDDMFTKSTGITVSTRLVAGGSLLPSVLSGIGPDLCLSRSATDAVNYAFRGAVMNLNDEKLFPGASEIFNDRERFAESALEPFTFGNGIYGMPETQDFYMVFYRTDILEEMGLEPPETWDDVYSMIQDLQNKQMEFAMPVPVVGAVGSGNLSYAMLLYQKGGEYYNEDRSSTALTTDAGLNAFKEWTEFYTLYDLPNTYDFANRFRTGEVPVGVASYSMYSTLAVFAPEIQGLWEFSLVPGTERVDENGNTYIDHSCGGNTSSCIMLSMDTSNEEGVNRVKRAWEFMKWWTGEDAQYRFGTEIESLLGAAARYQTANIKAMSRLPWDKKSMNTIQEQWKYVRAVPQAPGAYYTARNIEFAWKEVINNNSDPNTTFYEYVSKINQEVARKSEEFADKIAIMRGEGA